MVLQAPKEHKRNTTTIMSEPSQEGHPRRNSCAHSEQNNENDPPQDFEENEDSDNRQFDGESDVGNSCSNTSDGSGFNLEAAKCLEKMPSSDGSNKENFSGVSNCANNTKILENDSDLSDEYESTDHIPFTELLKIHPKQLVSGFEFGEAIKRRAQETMKSARDKSLEENRRSLEGANALEDTKNEDATDLEKPCCSKTMSEKDHKTPHSYKRQRLFEARRKMTSSDIEFTNTVRRIPESIRDYPDCVEVWVYMIYKEEAAVKMRNARLFNDFKSVTPRMRAILLDWLMEVSSVYHLRRVTYYLAVDYFDRFLTIRSDVPKNWLQLVGITCLYIAAKVEEIYPPNLSEFAYVCDGACESVDMVSCELLILNSLGWEVILTTPSDWLNLYMQLHLKSNELVRSKLSLDFNRDFLYPEYSAFQFTRASQLMDLLSLDPGFLKFNYSTIAATAMYYMYGEETSLSVSGLKWEQLKSCAEYMEVFFEILRDAPDPRLQSCLGGPHPSEIKGSNKVIGRSTKGKKDENYSFQTHVANMDYFEKATIIRLDKLRNDRKIDADYRADTPVTSKNVSESSDDEHDVPETGEQDSNSEKLENGSKLLKTLTEQTTDNLDQSKSQDPEHWMSLDEIFELILSQDESKKTDM